MEVEFFTRWLYFIIKIWQKGQLQYLRLGLKALRIEKTMLFPRYATINAK